MQYKDYITTIYIIVDDILKLLKHKHKTNKPKFSDSQLITFLVFAMMFRKGEYKETLKEFKENYSELFPYIPNLSAIVKRARKNRDLVNILLIILRNIFLDKETTIAIVDTKPIPVCKNQRIMRNKKLKGKEYKGNNGNREWYGFKLCLLVDYYERPIAFNVMPASRHDINFLKEIKREQTVMEYLKKKVIVADKAFNSKGLKEEFERMGIELEAIKKGRVHPKQRERQEYLKRVRKKIETAFSRLYFMGIENIRAISLEGFITKIYFFVLALQFKVCLNS